MVVHPPIRPVSGGPWKERNVIVRGHASSLECFDVDEHMRGSPEGGVWIVLVVAVCPGVFPINFGARPARGTTR